MSKAAGPRTSADAAIRARDGRGIDRCWWAWSWRAAGRLPRTCFPATGLIARRSGRSSRMCDGGSPSSAWCGCATGDGERAGAPGAEDGGDRYIVGLQRRRTPTAQAVLAAARQHGGGQPLPDGGRAVDVSLPPDGARYIVVHSPERRAFERAMRRQDMRRCRDALRTLQAAVAAGRLKTPEKIGARAGAILRAYRGSRYFTWRLTPDGQFQFALDRMTLRAERRV